VETASKARSIWYWQPTKKLLDAGFIARCLSDELAEAIREAEALNAKLDAWYRGSAPPPAAKAGTLRALEELFERDDQFRGLRERSRRDHLYNIQPALLWAGDTMVKAITRKAIKEWLRGLQESRGPSTARGAGAALRRLISFAVDEGWLLQHPALKLRLPTPPQRSRVWTLDERDRFCAMAMQMGRPSLALAVLLGWWLAQRPADLRTLAWSAYDGSAIRLRQAKSERSNRPGRLVTVPVLPELRAALSAFAQVMRDARR
jgi:integrase